MIRLEISHLRRQFVSNPHKQSWSRGEKIWQLVEGGRKAVFLSWMHLKYLHMDSPKLVCLEALFYNLCLVFDHKSGAVFISLHPITYIVKDWRMCDVPSDMSRIVSLRASLCNSNLAGVLRPYYVTTTITYSLDMINDARSKVSF